MVFPTLPQSAQAEEAESKVSLSVAPVISLSLQDTVAVDVTPTQDGTFSSNTAALSISTNNETGYSLYMATSNGKNTLTSQNPGTSDVISAVNGGDNGVTSANFTNNTWGYNLSQDSVSDATAYKAVPTATGDTALITTSSPTEADTYNLTFGTKVDTSLPSGTYSNDVVVSVVANPEYVPTISEVADMQDVTAEICAASAEGETATLIDARDGSDYTVAKINGNCWMTQNLRLSGGRTLTSADSNVASSWSFLSTPLEGSSYSYTDPQVTISSNTSYGGYYNFCAASAGTNCQTSSTVNTTYDICPKGWRLPTLNEMNGITSYGSAFSPVLSGLYSNGTLYDTGSYGYWWSATALNSNYQYRLSYYGSSLYTDYSSKYLGFSVRCIRSNPGTLTINFDGNGSTGGSTASQQIAAGNTASLNTNGFTRTGYVFTGWNTAKDGSGTSYADGADYTVTPATGDATITLYAQWEALPTMQEFTLAQCQSLASDANYTVVDSRDGSDYTVRYINGACWMTSNLRLSGGRTLTSADSNVASSWEFPSNSLTSGNSHTEARSAISSNTSYGGYYNYCAASAGTVCSSSLAQDATQDICPKGWRLPTLNEMSGITSYTSAFSPVLSGRYSNGSLLNTGSDGYWWSATAYDSYVQYYLYYNGSSLNTGYYLRKNVGFSVRCIRSS